MMDPTPAIDSRKPAMGAPGGESSVEALAETFQRYAGHYAGVSPLYEQLAAGIAQDPELLSLASETRHTPIPNVFLAAVQFLLLTDPSHPLAGYYPGLTAGPPTGGDPWPVFRDFCLRQQDALRPLLRERLCQTNEVRRCAILLPAFGLVAAQAPGQALALLEVGASAGFNLMWDHYAYDYGDGQRFGAADARLQLSIELKGARRPLLPAEMPAIAHRQGLDLAPVDIRDPDAALWLRALIWPGQHERVHRLAEAIAVTRSAPPTLIAGDALAQTATLAAQAPTDAAFVVYHSFVFNQITEADRQAFHRTLLEVSHQRPVWRIALEWIASEHPQLSLTRYENGSAHETVLAHCGGHGNWLEWLA